MNQALKKSVLSFFILIIAFQVTLDLEAKNERFPNASYHCKESNKNDLGHHDIKTKIHKYNYQGSKFKVKYLYTPYYCKNPSLTNDKELESLSCDKNSENSPFILEAVEPMNSQGRKAIHAAKINKNFHVHFNKEKSIKFSNACIYGNNQRIIELWNQGLFIISDENINNLVYPNYDEVPWFHFSKWVFRGAYYSDHPPAVFLDLNKLHKHSKQKLVDIKFFKTHMNEGKRINPRFSKYDNDGYQLEFKGIELCFEHKRNSYPSIIACNLTQEYNDNDLIYVENGSFDTVHIAQSIKGVNNLALNILLAPITIPFLLHTLYKWSN